MTRWPTTVFCVGPDVIRGDLVRTHISGPWIFKDL
nr:MAG TPA: hypothetical protein [Caudoviricetes sp.]